MRDIKRILVVNRLSQYTRDALNYGVTLAKRFEAELYFLRVFSNPVDLEAVNAPSLFFKGEEYKNYLSTLDQYKEELDKIVRGEIRDKFPIKKLITETESLAEIVRVVREEKIDLLVILAHEEGRLEHLLFGENDALIRTLPCSIFLMKHEPKSTR